MADPRLTEWGAEIRGAEVRLARNTGERAASEL